MSMQSLRISRRAADAAVTSRRAVLSFGCLALLPLLGQDAQSKPQKVELRGTIVSVRASMGQGMPFIEIKTEKGQQRVLLGSMRYLLEHNFNPKAGAAAIVKGFFSEGSFYAQSVSLPDEKSSIELRDDNGIPLWRRGHYGARAR